MTDCARGCTTLRHRTDCPDTDTCPGCLPRQAEYGLLCERCYTALRRDVATSPSLVDWLRQHVEPGSPNQDGRIGGTRTPPAPLSTDAVAAADDLHAMLASWALLILEEHPGQLHGPDWRGSDVRPTSKRVVLGEHVYEDARVTGIRSDDTGATERICTWLLARLDDGWTTSQDWIGEMVREVTGTTATLLARWPQEARARSITDLPCPRCDRLSLVYYPVTVVHGSVLVQCEHQDCGCTIGEDMWPHYARVIIDARRSA